eukprot:PITA_15366
MEENETIASFVARIKDLKKKLVDIGHTVDDTDLVTITMNGVTDDYQMFITRINAKEKIPHFEELTGNVGKGNIMKNIRSQKRHASHLANGDQVQNFRLFVADCDENIDADIWYVDSGTSTHMTGNKHWLEDFKEINEGAQIYLGDDRSNQIKGCGKVFVILPNGNIKQIYNAMYVPGITKNLISISMIINQDLKVEFLKSNCYIKDLLDGMKTIATGIRTGGLYKLDVRPAPVRALTTTSLTTEELWH